MSSFPASSHFALILSRWTPLKGGVQGKDSGASRASGLSRVPPGRWLCDPSEQQESSRGAGVAFARFPDGSSAPTHLHNRVRAQGPSRGMGTSAAVQSEGGGWDGASAFALIGESWRGITGRRFPWLRIRVLIPARSDSPAFATHASPSSGRCRELRRHGQGVPSTKGRDIGPHKEQIRNTDHGGGFRPSWTKDPRDLMPNPAIHDALGEK